MPSSGVRTSLTREDSAAAKPRLRKHIRRLRSRPRPANPPAVTFTMREGFKSDVFIAGSLWCRPGISSHTRSWHTLPALRGYPADCKPLRFRRGFQTELFFDMRAMHVHGLGAEMKPAGDFLRAPAFAKQTHHFQFAVAQLGFRSAANLAGSRGHGFQNLRGHARTHRYLAAQHGAD